jgi:hypothetical protein
MSEREDVGSSPLERGVAAGIERSVALLLLFRLASLGLGWESAACDE